ncbi:molecular chaperone DnaJ, partial [Bradyrhizobium sp. BRP05]|nr:molecular chaperone DnaJ [Bradyrhizobium sp. BRP05]
SGTTPRVCPTCVGSGTVSRGQGAFALSEPCRDCRGRGMIVDDPCTDCHGSGRASSARTMQVRIPAGVQDAQRIRLKGKGAQGERGGQPGDLYVTVHVEPHPVFGRKGDNLTVTVPVTFPEAALGGTIE